MISRCCLSEVFIEGSEFIYYACLDCGRPCELRPAETKLEIVQRVMGTVVADLITNERWLLVPSISYKEENYVQYA